MEPMNDIGILSSDILKNELNIVYKSSIDSTNTHAKDNYERLTYPSVILTSLQLNGRGRSANSWTPTAVGDSLYATWCFQKNIPPSPVLSMRIGLLLQSAIEVHFNIRTSLKAPNDVYIQESKVSGILIEGVHYKELFHTFIGIGINVFSKPPIENTTYLVEHSKFDIKIWRAFLMALNNGMIRQIDSTQNTLNRSEQQLLLVALRRHANFNNLQSVSDSGNLVFPDKTISWLDL